MARFRMAGAARVSLALAAFGLSACQTAGARETAAAGYEDFAPYAQSSVMQPPVNEDENGWAAYRNMTTPPSPDRKLRDPIQNGAIDIHAHFGPDTYKRQWDAFEIARRAQEYGMRGLVLKSHWSETATLAELAHRYAAPEVEEFGGLVLNTTIGGINPMAVRAFAEIEGRRAKIVWMPTHDAQHEVTVLKQQRPFVRVSRDGELLPQVFDVLDLIKHYDLTLATGHVSPAEMLMIVAAAQERGIDRIIITHPGLGPMFTDPTAQQLQQAVAMGAYAEVVASELFSAAHRKATVAMMREIGPDHLILSTDSGLTGTPNHTDALAMSAQILREEGFTEAELDQMAKINPAIVLGLGQTE
ncbi:DUF6282 family protein [Altericroceibacterium endophyticum]|uniref:Amidohydrolase family protein n=1 Tax=Altericroceibacterium endophyticum TaxID=1808508 RepID=A0A6I4TAB0_9SPHN|nr:DUF6282 family protein [Altericroceibacterium endophyticum]MXO67111.1 hypothetical protein [Altericroceibacterium endophyticum]